MKTGSQIQGDIYALIKADTALCTGISGGVYRDGYRPRDSRLEDIVVIFTEGSVGDIDTGTVTVNIYVPDIDSFSNGVMVQDGARTAQLEALAAAWVESLTANRSNYLFHLAQTIYTEADAEINQHFVVVSLKYKYYDKV
ncbi:MAG: hypothetical protein IKR17_02875 [Bacteroidales bacterium]|nr:hypothetical protein [Bacteroidales bacterium]